MDPQRIKVYLLDDNPDAVLFENMDCALVGIGSFGTCGPVAVYSQQKIFEKLGEDGFDEGHVIEYFNELAAGEYGENTPVILRDVME